MRLVTVNLYNDRVVAEDLRRFLSEVKPDILCGQEVGPQAGSVLEEHFPEGRIEPSLDFRGRAVVGRVPIDPRPIELDWRGGFRTAVDLDGTAIEIISAHLANPIDRETGVPVRRRQLAKLEAELESLETGVLVGDMNATPLWPAYRHIHRVLDDGIAGWAARTGRRPPATWGPTPSWPAVLRIDHVFTKGIEVVGARVERIAGLDHRAVVADLVVTPQVMR